MVENRELYSFEEENQNQIQGPENENEEENTLTPGFPSKFIAHIIVSLFCLLFVLTVCKTNTSWGNWMRRQFHTAINASTQETFGYLSNTEFIKNVVKSGSSLIRLEEITRISAQKLHLSDKTPVNKFSPSIWPVQGSISRGFGWQENRTNNSRQFHPGVEYTTGLNAAVTAISNGKVLSVTQNQKNGAEIVIDHENGWTSSYQLIEAPKVHAGQSVNAGAIIAQASGNKLILELRHHGRPVDPLTVIPN